MLYLNKYFIVILLVLFFFIPVKVACAATV